MKIILDEYNSNIFQIKMGNIIGFELKKTHEDIIKKITKTNFDHLSVKVDTSDKKSLNFFLNNDFYLVDTQVRYQLNIKNTKNEKNLNVRGATINDAQLISEIAAKSFSIDRFHSDMHLNKEKSDNYYRQWSINLLKESNIKSLVYVEDMKIVGFSFWREEIDVSTLILVAVSEDSRGKGIYRQMISHYLSEKSGEIKTIFMGTQIDNYPVHKTWANLGATIIDSKYVLHRKENNE